MAYTLEQLGFTKNESLIYEVLLEDSGSFVAAIIRSTQKHRQVVYSTLDSLAKKGMVTITKKQGKNFYQLADPSTLLTSLKQKEIIAESIISRVQRRQSTEKEQVEVFSGSESYVAGMKSFRTKAEEFGEFIAIRGEVQGWLDYLGDDFHKHALEVQGLKKKGITPKVLFFEKDRSDAGRMLHGYVDSTYVIKVSSERDRLPHTAWIAGSHVYILTPATEPLVVHIQSTALAQQYRNYFEQIWKSGELLK